jgi:hypothetical protein
MNSLSSESFRIGEPYNYVGKPVNTTYISKYFSCRQELRVCVWYSDWLRDRSSSPSKVENFHFFISSRPALGPTQPHIQWVLGSLSPRDKPASLYFSPVLHLSWWYPFTCPNFKLPTRCSVFIYLFLFFIFLFFLFLVSCSLGEIESTWNVGHYLAYCTSTVDGWWWVWSSQWNHWQRIPKYSEKTCPSAALSTNRTWPDLCSNPGLRDGTPATNRLSYGTAIENQCYCCPDKELKRVKGHVMPL